MLVGDRFVRVDDRSKGFKSRYSRKSTKDTFRKLHNVSMQATIWSRSFMEWVHHLFAGCCFFSLVFLPVTDVSNSPGTIAPPIFYNSSIFNITSTPSALQLFLGTYSNVALPMSWMFNILVTIVMFSVIDLFTNIMPKNHATDAEEVKRQQYISRKSRKMYISSLKVALVLGEFVYRGGKGMIGNMVNFISPKHPLQ